MTTDFVSILDTVFLILVKKFNLSEYSSKEDQGIRKLGVYIVNSLPQVIQLDDKIEYSLSYGFYLFS